MNRFARKALVFVCVFSMGCQHGNIETVDEPIEPMDIFAAQPTDPPEEEEPVEEPVEEPIEEPVEEPIAELPAPEPAPEPEPEPVPEPIATPGSFKRLARACVVFSEASETGAILNTLPQGRKVWTEEVDSNYVRVYRSSGAAYLKVECFTAAPEVAVEEPMPTPEPPPAKAEEPIEIAQSEPPPEIRHEPEIKPEVKPEMKPEPQPEPITAATVESPEPPPPPPAPPSTSPLDRIVIEQVQDDGITPFVLGGIAGLTIFALFYLLTSRRQRRIDFNRTMTMTAL